jgi:uncharacterized protein YabN with tetrapyrrole methylase and pyrophosphatase domain
MAGRLVVVGTGIRLVEHVTLGARTMIERADKVLCLAADPTVEEWVRRLNPTTESLSDCYVPGQVRYQAYHRMVERILAPVRQGWSVCAAFYGHPGVFVYPSHEAIRLARAEGYPAEMHPGISAEDCLFADLGIDPARTGCQSYEATDFLVSERKIDPRTSLILWQVGLVGRIDLPAGGFGDNRACLSVLRDTLLSSYSAGHEVVIYEASPYVGVGPTIRAVHLNRLLETPLSALSTLYVPPLPVTVRDAALQRLGLDRTSLLTAPPCWQGIPPLLGRPPSGASGTGRHPRRTRRGQPHAHTARTVRWRGTSRPRVRR